MADATAKAKQAVIDKVELQKQRKAEALAARAARREAKAAAAGAKPAVTPTKKATLRRQHTPAATPPAKNVDSRGPFAPSTVAVLAKPSRKGEPLISEVFPLEFSLLQSVIFTAQGDDGRIGSQMENQGLSSHVHFAKRRYSGGASVRQPSGVAGATAKTDSGASKMSAGGGANEALASRQYAAKIAGIMQRSEKKTPKPNAMSRWKKAKVHAANELNDATAMFAKVVLPEKVMTMANMTHLLDPWPSEEIKKKAGRNHWPVCWRPRAGDVGDIIKRWNAPAFGERALLVYPPS